VADKVRILGIAGSLRERSYNRAPLREAHKPVPSEGTNDIFDVTPTPAFNQDQERTPPLVVVDLKSSIRNTDVFRPHSESAWAGAPGCRAVCHLNNKDIRG
jgi:chromate reductase